MSSGSTALFVFSSELQLPFGFLLLHSFLASSSSRWGWAPLSWLPDFLVVTSSLGRSFVWLMAAVSFIGLLFLNAIYVGVCWSRQEYIFIFPLRLLRFLTSLTQSMLLMPLVNILTNGFCLGEVGTRVDYCWQYNPALLCFVS